jgi:hypothetical protein
MKKKAVAKKGSRKPQAGKSIESTKSPRIAVNHNEIVLR